ncbi:melatonin receptor type 1B-B-like [Mya arenaria]|uniref:melatonin receptor type 1B-B-like n=1 Tax=Mya arenaria TaxID=6604 RepID=UPI0022E5F3D6|nr:melatonin receptor type 1B-B-like [Mya arenaria]XP_052777345.1 melatonin receptor type 1B-B-like [Mya arenaria]
MDRIGTIASNNISDQISSAADGYFGRHEFITTQPAVAVPCVIILSVASLLGTFGNVLILYVIATKSRLRNKMESTFIASLAISDLYVTLIADPMSLVAKVEGEDFFEKVPGLCETVASLCTISCVTSLLTIAMMSMNRYFFICANDIYRKIFTRKRCIAICVSVYFVGTTLVLLNTAGVGDHGFDTKSLECIWDRMATYPYTVIFSIVLVWIPAIIIGACYLRIYMFVRTHRLRLKEARKHLGGNQTPLKSYHLAKTLFVIYIVFITCWAPYALLMVADFKDTFAHEVHVYITMFAHLHPSLNWMIYYLTNKHFAKAYKEVFASCYLNVIRALPVRVTSDSNKTGTFWPSTLKFTKSKLKHSQTYSSSCHQVEVTPGSEITQEGF